MTQLIMLIGLPGSGKSYLAEQYKEDGYIVHSSDSIRKELYGDESTQGDPTEVFRHLHARIKEDLSKGLNCVYDATNISYKRRKAFLESLNKVECEKTAILVATPFEICLLQNEQRERVVPYNVMVKMYKNFDPPCYYEGWDNIRTHYRDSKYCSLYGSASDFILSVYDFNQCNSHHALTLGEHCRKAAQHIADHYGATSNVYDSALYYAAILHDCGKPFTKEFRDYEGNVSKEAHYYRHENVGAYNSLFYSVDSDWVSMLDVSVLIRWHMQMWFIDKQPHTERKYREMFGSRLWNDLRWLHEADVESHN